MDYSGLVIKLPIMGIDLKDLEKIVLIKALILNGWMQNYAADFLGISRFSMNHKIKKYKITHPDWNVNRPKYLGIYTDVLSK